MQGARLAAISLLASASACFSPSAAECALRCAGDDECPGAMICGPESGLCRSSAVDLCDQPLPQTWWDPAWSARVPLAVSGDFWEADFELVDFPLQVAIDDPELLALAATSDGRDLRFVHDGAVLAHEIELFNGQSLRAWVRLPVLTRDQDLLHLYLGNREAEAHTAPVWDEDYLAVYHLAGSMVDSSGNGYDGSPQGGLDRDGDGPMAPGLRFDPDENTRVSLPAALVVEDTFTVEAWFSAREIVEGNLVGRDIHDPEGVTHDRGWVLDTNRDANDDRYGLSFRMAWSATERSELRVVDVLERGAWYYAAAIYEPGGEATLCYFPGECTREHFGDLTPYDNGKQLQIGAEAGDAFDQIFSGAIAEVRLSRGARPIHYFQAVYANAQSSSSVVEVGELEVRE